MKVSEIAVKNLADYLKLDYQSLSEEEILEARRLQIPIAIISETNLLKGTKEQITYEEVIDDYITHPNFNELIKRRRRNR